MKILYHHRIASKDGQYVHVAEIINALRDLGHEVVVVEPESINRQGFGESSALVRNIRKYLPKVICELAEFLYCFIDFLRLAKTIYVTQPDVIYERHNLFLPSGIWAGMRFRLPIIVEVNAPLFEERSRYGRISLPRLAKWSERYVWRHADRVLPVTAVLSQRIIGAGVDPKRVMVIPNGINRSQFFGTRPCRDIRKNLGLQGKLVLGFTGFVRDWHRLDLVLDVLKLHADEAWHFLVVGEGPACGELRDKAATLGIGDQVTFAGLVSREEIGRYIASFDIALQPDVVEYASPLKLFEYLALAKPVLAPNKANIREVLTHEKDALLFDPDNEQDFCDELERLCLSPELQTTLSENGRALIDERGYYWDENAKKIVYLFTELMGEKVRCLL